MSDQEVNVDVENGENADDARKPGSQGIPGGKPAEGDEPNEGDESGGDPGDEDTDSE